MAFLRHRHFELTERAIQVPDALGLGLFAATGTHQALLLDLPGIVAVLMGVITSVLVAFCAMSCAIEYRPRFTATALTPSAPLRGWVYVGLWQLETPGWMALLVSVSVTAGLRWLALWRNWVLPVWKE
jgi:uncharacterized membrane protein YeiH